MIPNAIAHFCESNHEVTQLWQPCGNPALHMHAQWNKVNYKYWIEIQSDELFAMLCAFILLIYFV